MTALVINDLPGGKDLDRAAMTSTTGGHGRGKYHRRKHRRHDSGCHSHDHGKPYYHNPIGEGDPFIIPDDVIPL